MNIQFNPSFQSTSGLNIYRINQSVAEQKQGTAEQTNIDIRLDTVLISPQGQAHAEAVGFVQPSWAESLSFEAPKTGEESQFVTFTGDNVSDKARELASLMSETPVGVAIDLDGMSMEQLANLSGGIGRQIDDAFATGEISKQEYEDLNKGLGIYTSFMTEKAETEKAMWAVLRQASQAVRSKIDSGASNEEVKVYAEQIRASWPDKISEFLKDNSYDRTLLNQMIAMIRDGNVI